MVQFGAKIFCKTFVELFWSVQVVLKKETLTKSHDYSRLFSKEKRQLKKTERPREPKGTLSETRRDTSEKKKHCVV